MPGNRILEAAQRQLADIATLFEQIDESAKKVDFAKKCQVDGTLGGYNVRDAQFTGDRAALYKAYVDLKADLSRYSAQTAPESGLRKAISELLIKVQDLEADYLSFVHELAGVGFTTEPANDPPPAYGPSSPGNPFTKGQFTGTFVLNPVLVGPSPRVPSPTPAAPAPSPVVGASGFTPFTSLDELELLRRLNQQSAGEAAARKLQEEEDLKQRVAIIAAQRAAENARLAAARVEQERDIKLQLNALKMVYETAVNVFKEQNQLARNQITTLKGLPQYVIDNLLKDTPVYDTYEKAEAAFLASAEGKIAKQQRIDQEKALMDKHLKDFPHLFGGTSKRVSIDEYKSPPASPPQAKQNGSGSVNVTVINQYGEAQKKTSDEVMDTSPSPKAVVKDADSPKGIRLKETEWPQDEGAKERAKRLWREMGVYDPCTGKRSDARDPINNFLSNILRYPYNNPGRQELPIPTTWWREATLETWEHDLIYLQAIAELKEDNETHGRYSQLQKLSELLLSGKTQSIELTKLARDTGLALGRQMAFCFSNAQRYDDPAFPKSAWNANQFLRIVLAQTRVFCDKSERAEEMGSIWQRKVNLANFAFFSAMAQGFAQELPVEATTTLEREVASNSEVEWIIRDATHDIEWIDKWFKSKNGVPYNGYNILQDYLVYAGPNSLHSAVTSTNTAVVNATRSRFRLAIAYMYQKACEADKEEGFLAGGTSYFFERAKRNESLGVGVTSALRLFLVKEVPNSYTYKDAEPYYDPI